MKKILILLTTFTLLLSANDLEKVDFDSDNFNLLCINPLISDQSKKSKVYKAIEKGYRKQIISLTYKLQKFDNLKYKHYQGASKIKGDREAGKELVEMLKVVNEYYEKHDQEKVKTEVKLDDDLDLDEELDFSASDINELTEKGESTVDKYKEAFINTLDMLPTIYPIGKTDNNLWQIPYQINDEVVVVPNVFFGEYFNPSKQGRRYFLSINVFIFILDSDGDARVMVQEISDYNWKRNYRFITAQSGKAIQDTITKMTGVDIK